MSTLQTHTPTGLYVLVKDKAEALARVEAIGVDCWGQMTDREAVLRCRKVCHEIIVFLQEFFRTETCAVDRSLRLIKGMDTDNALLARRYGQQLYGFLTDLKMIIVESVAMNDMPSCRKLLDDPIEIAASKATDLIKNNIIKGAVHILHIGKDVCDLVNIADVDQYYKACLQEFEEEKASGWTLSPAEQCFESKALMEREYCKLASLYVAGKLTNDVLETGRLAVEEYQRRIETMINPKYLLSQY